MNKEIENQKIEELRKMKKRKLKDLEKTLIVERESVVEERNAADASYKTLVRKLVSLTDAKDEDKTEDIEKVKSTMAILEKELSRLEKREKALTEELELVSRAFKNDYDGKSGAWTTVGAWIIGAATTGLSAWGLAKSHKAFNDGTMVDKTTRGLAERLSGLFSFMSFRKN